MQVWVCLNVCTPERAYAYISVLEAYLMKMKIIGTKTLFSLEYTPGIELFLDVKST